MATFYRCEVCGNLPLMMVASGAPMTCCGQQMTALNPGTTDAALEKHVPFVTLSGDQLHVQIGEVVHPMQEEHYIQFILVEQGETTQIVHLKPGQEPKATFTIDPSRDYVVYEFCNLHGLWKK